jgi:hypothetical protein
MADGPAAGAIGVLSSAYDDSRAGLVVSPPPQTRTGRPAVYPVGRAQWLSLIAIRALLEERSVVVEDILHKVNRLIRECKEQGGPGPTSPQAVGRYVALSLGIAEPVADGLILEAGRRGANPDSK